MAGRWRWLVLMAVYVTNLIGSGTSFTAGMIYVAILERFQGDRAKAATVLSLNSGLLALLGPVTTAIVNKYSCRVSVVLGGLFMAVSGLLSAFVDSVGLLMFTYGIIGGIGLSLILVPQSLILCFYFKEHANLTIAISNGIIGLSMFLASPVTMFFLDKYALSGTFLIFGALNAHVCVAGMLSKPSTLEIQAKERKETKAKDKVKTECSSSADKPGERLTTTKLSWKRRKRPRINVAFFLFLVSTLTWNFVMAVCVVHLPNYAFINGLSNEDVTLLMTCLSVCNTVGRFLPVVTAMNHRIDLQVVHTLSLGLMGALTVTFPWFSTYMIGKYVFSATVGLCTGLSNSLMTPITILLVGLEKISTAHGFAYFFCGIGYLLGPIVAGLLYGLTGSYRNSFIFAGVVSLVGCGFALAARCTMSRKDSLKQTDDVSSIVLDDKHVLNALLETETLEENK